MADRGELLVALPCHGCGELGVWICEVSSWGGNAEDRLGYVERFH